MKVREKLEQMGLKLPRPFVYPKANRRGCVTTGRLVYTSGHPPPENFGVKTTGKVGENVTEEEAYDSARATALSILASLENEIGSRKPEKTPRKMSSSFPSARVRAAAPWAN